MQLHSFPRYISSSILSSLGVVVVLKCFFSFFYFLILFSFLCFFFSIVDNWCRGSELSRDPGGSVSGVNHDCCFFLLLLWLLVCRCFFLRRSVMFLFPSFYGWYLSVLKMSAWVFFSKLWKIFERLVHVHLENNCLAHLISSTWQWKNAN